MEVREHGGNDVLGKLRVGSSKTGKWELIRINLVNKRHMLLGVHDILVLFAGCELASLHRSQKGMLYLPAACFKKLFLF